MSKSKQIMILSIKLEDFYKIKNGEKKIEIRKDFPKYKEQIKRVYCYVTEPIKKILCVFEISDIKIGEPQHLYDCYDKLLGISYEDYIKYTKNCKNITFIFIKNFQTVNLSLSDFNKKIPPLSYYYA